MTKPQIRRVPVLMNVTDVAGTISVKSGNLFGWVYSYSACAERTKTITPDMDMDACLLIIPGTCLAVKLPVKDEYFEHTDIFKPNWKDENLQASVSSRAKTLLDSLTDMPFQYITIKEHEPEPVKTLRTFDRVSVSVSVSFRYSFSSEGFIAAQIPSLEWDTVGTIHTAKNLLLHEAVLLRKYVDQTFEGVEWVTLPDPWQWTPIRQEQLHWIGKALRGQPLTKNDYTRPTAETAETEAVASIGGFELPLGTVPSSVTRFERGIDTTSLFQLVDSRIMLYSKSDLQNAVTRQQVKSVCSILNDSTFRIRPPDKMLNDYAGMMSSPNLQLVNQVRTTALTSFHSVYNLLHGQLTSQESTASWKTPRANNYYPRINRTFFTFDEDVKNNAQTCFFLVYMLGTDITYRKSTKSTESITQAGLDLYGYASAYLEWLAQFGYVVGL